MIKITKVERNDRYNRITFLVEDINWMMEKWTHLRVFSGISAVGPWDPFAPEAYIELTHNTEIYTYTDISVGATSTKWYCANPWSSGANGDKCDPMQASTELDKIGWTFRNYAPPTGEWGEVLTPDDIRYTFMWGIDCTASDIAETDFEDEQFEYFIEEALYDFEKELTIDIRKHVYKVEPADTLVRSKYWREGVDYTDEEDYYSFDPLLWRNFGFLQLRHMPVLSVETAILQSPVGGDVLDLIDSNWIRVNKQAGQLHFYPTTGSAYSMFMSGVLPWRVFSGRYPQGFKIEYTSGFPTAEFVPNDLRGVIAKWATIKALQSIGDGLLAGFSSQSVGLDGLSESFSSTQSATSAYFGARLLSYQKEIAEWLKRNRSKYAPIPMSFVGY